MISSLEHRVICVMQQRVVELVKSMLSHEAKHTESHTRGRLHVSLGLAVTFDSRSDDVDRTWVVLANETSRQLTNRRLDVYSIRWLVDIWAQRCISHAMSSCVFCVVRTSI